MKTTYMNSEELLSLAEQQVFEWVATKHWNLADFKKWSEEVKVQEYAMGYNEGWDTAKDGEIK
jgi:hypothetical protein